MLGLTRHFISGSGGARVFGCVLLAGAVLTACKHSNSTMTNTQGLWIANGTDVLEYIPSQLKGGTGATVPHLQLQSATLGAPQGVTFDKAGNLWVMDPEAVVNGAKTPSLVEFSAAQLAALATTPKPAPVATITYTAMKFPQQAIFDPNGNLWVADHDGDQVLVFTAAQVAMQGTNPTVPAVVITSAAFNGPLGIARDSAGDLWISNNGAVAANNSPAGTTIVEFTAAQLPMVPATGMVTPVLTPTVTLSDDGNGSIQSPWALAFDANGNLWSNNSAAPNTFVEFAKASLTTTAAPTPAITISPVAVNGTPSLDGPNGLCFDSVGDIANANSANAFGIPFYLKSQLTMTAAPIPNTFIVGTATTLDAPAGCTFGPNVN